MLRCRLPKSSHIRLSNWELSPLTSLQQDYAALDAIAALELFLAIDAMPIPPCSVPPLCDASATCFNDITNREQHLTAAKMHLPQNRVTELKRPAKKFKATSDLPARAQATGQEACDGPVVYTDGVRSETEKRKAQLPPSKLAVLHAHQQVRTLQELYLPIHHHPQVQKGWLKDLQWFIGCNRASVWRRLL